MARPTSVIGHASLVLTAALFLSACASTSQGKCGVAPPDPSVLPTATDTNTEPDTDTTTEPSACEGTPEPPPEFASKLEAIDDPELLASAIGAPDKGMLCQGQVYTVSETFTIYRAWNSTNPGSELGKWWAFTEPAGSVAQYREDYEICYQWSPLDKMTSCTVKAGTKLVVGNGQSAFCSEYLSYPVSAALQIYLADASAATEGCTAFTAAFEWQPG